MTCYCYATRAIAAISTIPSGTPVVIERFDTSSDVSHALYVPTTLSATPDHPLYFVNDFTYWVIHPDHVSLEAAGAPPVGGDCAPAMQNVLDYLASVPGNQVKLQLWERDYVLNSLSVAPTMPSGCGFSIIGRGQTVSRLLVPVSTNTSGAISVVFPDALSQFLLRDFSVIATGATEEGPGCGTAITMNFNSGEPRKQHGGIVENIHIGPDYPGADSGDFDAWSYFNTALDLTGTPRPLVSGSTFCGCDGSPANGNYTITSPRYYAGTHLVLNDCYEPRVQSSSFWHATTGISYICTGHNVQGFDMSELWIEGVRTGVYLRHGNQCPDGTIINCGVQFRDFGFDVGNISKWRFIANHCRSEWETSLAYQISYDMRFLEATGVTISASTFATGGNPHRVNIRIDADTSSEYADDPTPHGKYFLIDTNTFGEDLGAAYAISAIQVTGSANHIQIAASNVFVKGFFSGPTVDDASTTAATFAGFPTTNIVDGLPATAVVPNGDAMVGIPTLGSASVPWPASFSNNHTFPTTFEPDTPGSGWVLYTDSDGNLKARYRDGTTIVPLASHS